MRIKKEDYLKVNKKDREAYENELDSVTDYLSENGSTGISLIVLSVKAMVIGFIILPLWKLAYPGIVIHLAVLYLTIIKVFYYAIIIGFIIDLILIFIYLIKRIKIKSKFSRKHFEVKVK